MKFRMVGFISLLLMTMLPTSTCYIRQSSPRIRNKLFSSLSTAAVSPSPTPTSKVATFFYNDIYKVTLPPTNRFPMEKYALVRKGLRHHFQMNPQAGVNVEFQVSPLATIEELETTHCPTYIKSYYTGTLTPAEIRKTGFPLTKSSIARAFSSTGGTVAAMRHVLTCKGGSFVTGHVAGGTHHAFRSYGEGFCIFNDIAVASNVALKEFPDKVKQILIIDLDVHQGNGTADLFSERNKSDNKKLKPVFTFSMHCKENFFSPKQFSDLDVEVPAKTGDEEYLRMLENALQEIKDKLPHKPSLVFYQAGVDVFHRDRLGKLSLSREGLQRRNNMVYETVRSFGDDCKLVITLGGGYPKNLDPESQEFRETVQCHQDVYIDAIKYV